MGNIKKIRIQNFKSLKDITFDLKPLTFLFGPNSSGKSSVIKALMFLSKNLASNDKTNLSFDLGNNLDLNSYEQTVFNNDIKKDIKFSLFLDGEFEFISYDFVKILFLDKNERQKLNNTLNEIFMNYDDKIYDIEKDNLLTINSDLERTWHSDYIGNHYNPSFKKILKYKVAINFIFSHFEGVGYLKKLEIIYKEKKLKLIINQNRVVNTNTDDKQWDIYRPINLVDYSLLFDKARKQKTVRKKKTPEKINSYEIKYYFKNKELTGLSKNFLPFSPFEYKYEGFSILTISELLEKIPKLETKIIEPHIEKYFLYNLFIYMFYNIIPAIIELEFKRFFHAPTIREIPKYKYILNEKNCFSRNEYYGFLNFLEGELEYLLEDLRKEKKVKDEIKYLYKKLSDKSLEKKNYIVININKTLKYLGYDKFVILEKNLTKEFGYFYLLDRNMKKSFLINESSGFIQLLPIVISIQLARKSRPDHIEFNKESGFILYDYIDNVSFYLFEQPELHLHPKIQSKLTDVLIDTIKDTTHDPEGDFNIKYPFNLVTILVETHSEHMIKKLQVLVAKKKIDIDKIGVNYFYMNKGITKVKKMELDETGFFKEPWPDGFFDESYKLSFDLLMPSKN